MPPANMVRSIDVVSGMASIPATRKPTVEFSFPGGIFMMENEEFDEKGIKSVMDIFIESGLLGGRLSAMLNKKATAAQDMESALAAIDADGDGMTGHSHAARYDYVVDRNFVRDSSNR